MIVAATLLLPFALGFPHPNAPARPGGEPVPLLERIAVVGASVSHGYGLDAEVEARVDLSDVVEASLLIEHQRVRIATNLLFFTDPVPSGEALISKTKSGDPTLVVAIDYLFWFAYGSMASEDDRRILLDKGLASLEAFSCPVLVGDIPDMAAAALAPVAGGPPPLLAPEQVPPKESLEKLNRRLREWAQARKNVVVVPMADLLARLQEGREIEIRGNRWPADSRDRLLGPDRLHPTLEGSIALWLASADALVASREDLEPSTFEWRAATIRERIDRAKEKERAARREREGKKARIPAGGR